MITRVQAFGGSPSIEISPDLWYCKERNLYWKHGTVYCELSARHNGLIGAGAILRSTIKEVNND